VSKEKIAVAYSGGLDTSVIAKWLQEKYNADVITVSANLGQKKELVGVEEKAYKTGAKKAIVLDLQQEFATDFIFPALKAGALYEHTYPMATSLGRPLIAKALVDVARAEGCTAVAHGCTGKGNDQVRFEAAIAALAPELKVYAPLREWEFKSREEEIEYCQKHGIPVKATKDSPYSIDENMWGTSIECGILENPRIAPPEDGYQRTVSPEKAPDTASQVEIEFERGVPVSLNGVKMNPVDLIMKLNDVAGANGVGRLDLVENRLVGIKSRELYETPAATVLHFAHREIERLTLDKDTMHYKAKLSHDYADLIYNGLWYSPLRFALDAFMNETQKVVNGVAVIKLYKGNMELVSRWSQNSLYDMSLATYTEEDTFDHRASIGFIKIYSLPLKTYYRINGNPVSEQEIVAK
jgi:argininosuccinate synthase